jgi:hypothetical protein
MRFTLGRMFLAVGMLALACAGLTYRTYWWVSGIFSLTAVLFVAVFILGMCSSKKERIVLFAFTIGGASYLFLSLLTPEIRAIPTNYLLGLSVRELGLREEDQLALPALERAMRIATPSRDLGGILVFHIIGHCVFSWLFAVLAAWFAGRMYDRRERAEKEGA